MSELKVGDVLECDDKHYGCGGCLGRFVKYDMGSGMRVRARNCLKNDDPHARDCRFWDWHKVEESKPEDKPQEGTERTCRMKMYWIALWMPETEETSAKVLLKPEVVLAESEEIAKRLAIKKIPEDCDLTKAVVEVRAFG